MKRWGIRFRDRKPDEALISFLAKEFYQDLAEEKVTAEELKAASRLIGKRNRFYPVMADILDAVAEYRAEKRRQISAEAERRRQIENRLPDLSPEQIDYNLKQVRSIIDGFFSPE